MRVCVLLAFSCAPWCVRVCIAGTLMCAMVYACVLLCAVWQSGPSGAHGSREGQQVTVGWTSTVPTQKAMWDPEPVILHKFIAVDMNSITKCCPEGVFDRYFDCRLKK